jgi:ESCRT-I complex subunit VPS28
VGAAGGSGGASSASAISDATEAFITLLDALKLRLLAKDSLHPLLSDAITAAHRATGGADFAGRAKIVQWLIALNGMRATDELSEEQARELSFDMEQAYYGFKATLK